jgi:hypothetical protein
MLIICFVFAIVGFALKSAGAILFHEIYPVYAHPCS